TKARKAMARSERPRRFPPTRPGPPPDPDLVLDDLWQRGEHPDVRAFLAPLREEGLGLEDLLAVLRVDQRHRWPSCERVVAADSLSDFPSLPDDTEAAAELLYNEGLTREELPERPDPSEYAPAFPELADRLRLQLEVHEALSSDEIAA